MRAATTATNRSACEIDEQLRFLRSVIDLCLGATKWDKWSMSGAKRLFDQAKNGPPSSRPRRQVIAIQLVEGLERLLP